MTSLKSQLNRFIFSTSSDQKFISRIKREVTSEELKGKELNQERHQYQETAREIQRLRASRFQKGFQLTRKHSNADQSFKQMHFFIDIGPFYLNLGAFMPTIEMIGDQEQVKYWKGQTYSGRVVGAYAQTQVGHGSDVKSLQTQAVYDQKSQSWILNSPKVTSAKMWVGLLGSFCTHVVLQGRAIVKGKSLGIQTFVIQVRNTKLQLLPNVEAFDIGPKLGLDVIDNGSLIFNHMVVPRKSMLMKYIQVTPDGIVHGLQNTQSIKYSYGSMLNLRVQLVFGFAIDFLVSPPNWHYKVLKQNGTFMQPEHRRFIIDKLCLGLGIVLSNKQVYNLYDSYMSELANKNFKKADKLLASVHIISSTFKAVAGRIGIDSMTEMLTSYQFNHFKNSKMPSRFGMSIPCATFEGDNTVLLQQTSKFLLFKMDLQKDFSNIKMNFKSNSRSDAIAALEYIVIQKLKTVKGRIEELGEKGVPFKTIWNQQQQVSLVRTSQIWGFMTLLQLIGNTLKGVKHNQSFFDKISQGFTHNLLRRVYELDIEGFKVEWIATWKSFSDEEYNAMGEIGTPVQEEQSPLILTARNDGNWLSAKL